ncbi:hypothetical protein TPA0598_06_03590 [Streptomyces lydicamycinicus]|uniref:Uncharacterized protein n=2 Tax=Streptomyces lydicamycinicus TaxID=1546107 RepID=A0A0P4R9Q4_9ACTN|nr:hypothetical protein TPA0598_06_03590 [Streptomyces lydicamycinicus]
MPATDAMDEFAVAGSAMSAECDIWFAMPPGFVEVPLASPPDPPDATATDGLEMLTELVPEEQYESLRSSMDEARAMGRLLARTGAVHLSMGVHHGESGEVLHSVFLIKWEEVPWAPPKLAAAKAALASSEAREAELVDLPCGPAAVVESLNKREGQNVFQLTGYLPHPDGRRVAVLALSTTAGSDHEHYRDMFYGIVGMVSFDNPLPPQLREQIPEAQEVAAARDVFG